MTATGEVLAAVSEVALDVAAHEAFVAHAGAGATVVFCGVVRDTDGGRAVVELEYQGHPSAEQVLREIATEFAAEPDVLALAVSHRVGTLAVGDVALVAAVATDGTDEWVNCP